MTMEKNKKKKKKLERKVFALSFFPSFSSFSFFPFSFLFSLLPIFLPHSDCKQRISAFFTNLVPIFSFKTCAFVVLCYYKRGKRRAEFVGRKKKRTDKKKDGKK